MKVDVQETGAALLADLVTEAIRSNVGNVGVLVRDVPSPDPRRLLQRLKALREEEGVDLRIAYLRPGGREAAESLRLDTDFFDDRVEQAERWRNDPSMSALIVVIAHGDEAKLSSLEDFATITSRDLKEILLKGAVGDEKRAGQNDVQMRWWSLLARDNTIGLGQLMDYYLALQPLEGKEFLEASSREIFRLGLLPDPQLFDDPKESTVRERFQRNRELITTLQMLTPQDRRVIAQAVEAEEDTEEKKRLRIAIQQLERVRWEGEGLDKILFQDAERLLSTRSKKKDGNPPRPRGEQAVDVAAQSLIDEDRVPDVETIAKELEKQLNALDEPGLRPCLLTVRLSEVGASAITSARPDILSLVSKFLGEGLYGGLAEVEGPDLETALRRVDIQRHLIARWSQERLTQLFEHFATDDVGALLLERFRVYDEARAHVLPLARCLAAEPLVVAANPSTRKTLLAFVDAYEALMGVVQEAHEQLFARFGQDVDEALAHLLLLETIIVRTNGRTYALTAPTHPLYLWHYGRYCELVESQRDRLDDRDKALVAEAAKALPNFLTSLFVPWTAVGESKRLAFIGRLGPVPYYGEAIEASASDDGATPIRGLIEAYLALEPHARQGFRLALVDPPDAGVYLSLLADLADKQCLEGAHLTVFRHPGRKPGLELRLDGAEEERVARVFRAPEVHRRFTFEVHELRQQDFGPPSDALFHLVIVFDCSPGQTNRVRAALHPIQPLALPRRIAYRQALRTVELEPASGGPFDAYGQLVSRLEVGGTPSYLSVHQDEQIRASAREVSSRVAWFAIADRHVDQDLRIGALRIMTDRQGERDVAAFARSTAAFRRPLRDVVRTYNAYVSAEELDDLLGQLSDLLDSGLLNLRPDSRGNTNHNRVKGLLGTLIAARWFRNAPGGNERLLISLDSRHARRWMHLADDPVQADLLGFEFTGHHCTVSVVEVKAVQAPSTEYTVKDGVARGPAIDQMLSTRRLLQQVLARNRTEELITTPARREILREHLYRELTKHTYSPEQRREWADRLQRLLDGEVTADVRCHLVHVRLGVDSGSLVRRTVVAYEGEEAIEVDITELNEREIPALVPRSPEVPGEREEEWEVAVAEASGGLTRVAEVPPPPPPAPGPAVQPPPPRAAPRAEDAEPAAPERDRPRAFLGVAPGVYGNPRDIWFDPLLPEDRLPNPHVSITGETGSGKTQAIKAIVADLSGFLVPALILDFKDDYSDPGYAEAEHLRVYDPNEQPLPFNPLLPPLDPRSGQAKPSHHIHELGEIVKRIYGLGDQQTYRLREAMKAAYECVGIPIRPFTPNPEHKYPPFDLVREQLDPDKDAQLLGRLSPIFDLQLFASGSSEVQFASVLEGSTVVRLAQLPGEETKNAVAEFFLMALYNHLVRLTQTHTLGRLLVLDEAWRLVHSPFLVPLMREGRAFGLGVLIATQFPRDLPAEISGSTATKIFFSQSDNEHIRDIQRAIIGKTSGPQADHLAGVLRGLPPLTCVLHSKQYTPFVRVEIRPYFQRRPAMAP